jgi:carbamoylphosphate synthase large subunit
VGEARSAEESLKKALKSLDTAEAELSKAAVAEYRDQVKIFRDAVEDVRRQKDLTLEEAAEQLKGKAAPVIAAREQLDATIECPAADDAN